MAIDLINLKGTEDYMPRMQRIRQEIKEKLQQIFERYGYQPLETPSICYFDILSSKYAGGAEILKEVYKFRDQGERELGLRYDLTIPFARVIGMNPEIKMPFKRYEIGKVFRDGPVKLGRNREFIQCDVDVVGVKSVMAEAELMSMAVGVYKELGLDIYISYNNRKLLSGIIEFSGIAEELSAETILILDKLEKIGEEGVKAELIKLGIEFSMVDRLMSYMNMKSEELINIFSSLESNELIRLGLRELEELNSYLEAMEIRDRLKFSPSLARGLEIYTGTVWEVFLTDKSITSSVGAGGRYDKIIGAFLDNGKEYPAVGMTFGLDVIYEALMIKGIVEEKAPVDLYIIPMGTQRQCMKLILELRNKDLRVDMEMTDRKLKKSLDYANKMGIPYVIIIGENELNLGKVKIKDMNKGIDKEVSLCELKEEVNNLIR